MHARHTTCSDHLGACMFVPFIVWPGKELAGNPQDTQNASNLLSLCEYRLGDAAIALAYFEQSRAALDVMEEPSNAAKRHAAESYRRSVLKDEIRRERGSDAIVDENTLRIESGRRRVLEKISSGEMPYQFAKDLLRIYGQSYLFSLDMIWKSVGALGKDPLTSVSANVAKSAISGVIPDIDHVRDSSAHAEDRTRGLDRRGKPLDLKAVSNKYISAPAGTIFAFETIFGDDEFTSTASDGRLVSVRVSEEVLRPIQAALQTLIDAQAWWDDYATIAPND
jgi:hypothetical protein